MTNIRNSIFGKLFEPNPDAAYSLAFFRIGFGALMCFSLVRFALKGWIYDLYILPKVYFPFYGFEWIKPFSAVGMYVAFAVLILLTVFIAIGYFYRVSMAAFFMLFTYVELIDKTNYLNHYYFISLVSFLLIFLPMDSVYSVSSNSKKRTTHVLNWHLWVLLLQVGSVYFFAGIAKIKPDWLLHAQPLTIWLHANNDLPLIGSLLDEKITAYAASWFGMLFDVSLPFLLLWKPTRVWAYAAAIFFHLFTGMLFHIGMFPYIMIFCALLFFPSTTHKKWLQKVFAKNTEIPSDKTASFRYRFAFYALVPFFLFQILMPFRYLAYSGDPFWGEEGFRFSWNVMLMEKNGLCEFQVYNPDSQTTKTVYPHEWLTPQQERMMSTQPDMILQFAHILAANEKSEGNPHAQVYSNCYAAVNGRAGRQLIDTRTDLAQESESFSHKPWILNGL